MRYLKPFRWHASSSCLFKQMVLNDVMIKGCDESTDIKISYLLVTFCVSIEQTIWYGSRPRHDSWKSHSLSSPSSNAFSSKWFLTVYLLSSGKCQCDDEVTSWNPIHFKAVLCLVEGCTPILFCLLADMHEHVSRNRKPYSHPKHYVTNR